MRAAPYQGGAIFLALQLPDFAGESENARDQFFATE
jgi:hypothetical protein